MISCTRRALMSPFAWTSLCITPRHQRMQMKAMEKVRPLMPVDKGPVDDNDDDALANDDDISSTSSKGGGNGTAAVAVVVDDDTAQKFRHGVYADGYMQEDRRFSLIDRLNLMADVSAADCLEMIRLCPMLQSLHIHVRSIT